MSQSREGSRDAYQTVDAVRLYGQIVRQVEERILKGELRPGDRLPSQRELARQLGVGQVAVKEALRALAAKGLITVRHGTGTFVSEMGPAAVTDFIERYCVIGSSGHRELMELRETLEPASAAMAAERAAPEDLARLADLVDRIEAAHRASDFEEGSQVDIDFHIAVAEASQNDILVAMLKGLGQMLRAWIRVQMEVTPRERGAYSHRQVFEAIAAGDPERASQSMADSISTARDIENHIAIPQEVSDRFAELWPGAGAGRR